MKDLKFRLNKTKKQRETLTPAKVLVLKVISEGKDIFNQLVFVVKLKNDYYQLRQFNVNEFGLKKIIDINSVDITKPECIDVMAMTNHTKNGNVINYFSKPIKVNY